MIIITPKYTTYFNRKSVKSNEPSHVVKDKVAFQGFYLRKNIADYTILGQSRLTLGTRIYREPFLWKHLPDYLEKRFAGQSQVNVFEGGCSVGFETWGFKSVLNEYLKEASKKYSVFASDPDETSISLAKTHLMCFSHRDKDLFWHKQAGIKDFSEYFRLLSGNEKINELKKYYELMKSGKARNIEFNNQTGEIIQIEPSDRGNSQTKRIIDVVYKVDDDLGKNTTFEAGYIQDVLKKSKPQEPCLVILRNVACCLNKRDRTKLAEDIYNNIPKGSTLVIGDCDLTMYRNSPWSNELIGTGFERKSFVENTPQYYIFEKNI